MTGWAVLTIEPIDGQKWGIMQASNRSLDEHGYLDFDADLPDDHKQVQYALCEKLLEYDEVNYVGVDHPEVYAYSVYSWTEILKDLSGMWVRAVGITANDTGDTGKARLFQNQDGDVVKIDEYSEGQCQCCGGRTGKIAAAYMMYEHHINALADWYDHPSETFESQQEIQNNAE